MSFLVLSSPVGLHHQFGDPAINAAFKWVHMILTFGVAVPSFMTAFTVATSMEHAGVSRGASGLFAWWKHLPYFDKDWIFSYLFCGLVLFFFGGITGIINAGVVAMILAVLIAYVPPLYEVVRGAQEKAVPYRPWSPAPEAK